MRYPATQWATTRQPANQWATKVQSATQWATTRQPATQCAEGINVLKAFDHRSSEGNSSILEIVVFQYRSFNH